jgi:hypothetical protein
MLKKKDVDAWVVISDTHIGSQLGLCHKNGFQLDDGGIYYPNEIQQGIWKHWEYFWNTHVKKVLSSAKIKKYGIIILGDAVEGSHHGTTGTISNNLKDQVNHAIEIFSPEIEKCSEVYFLRGTPAHSGEASQQEEYLARILNAKPDKYGKYTRNELWLHIGDKLAHFTHHVGTCGAASSEPNAVFRELIECYIDSAKIGKEAPSLVVRAHRHKYIKIEVPDSKGRAIALSLPSWQLKTQFVYKISTRNQSPQIGGCVIYLDEFGEIQVKEKVWIIGRE